MLYQIENKYYIRVAPMKYTEVNFIIKNDDVVIQPTQNRILVTGGTKIKELNFQEEKNNIKTSLLEPKKETSETSTRGSKHRRRG